MALNMLKHSSTPRLIKYIRKGLHLNILKNLISLGFEDHEYEITKILLTVDEPHRYIILVVGMEGSGKTNLAKSVYDKNKVHFCTHAWVPISGKCSAVEILQDIRKEVIGSNQEPKGKRSLKEKLKQMLQNFFREKRYLIVLDDIPTVEVWDDLKDTFPNESNGSRIVITTRDMDIASHSDSRIFQYKLHLRSIDESSKELGTYCHLHFPSPYN
nr:disease resistance protein RPP13-like [Quercus suber]